MYDVRVCNAISRDNNSVTQRILPVLCVWNAHSTAEREQEIVGRKKRTRQTPNEKKNHME